MTHKKIIVILILSCYFFSYPCYSETDTLQQGQHLKDWDELISSNKVFSLKFFSFGTRISPYLGIFYRQQTEIKCFRCEYMDDLKGQAVWVANRNNPITDLYSKLTIDVYGKFSILSGEGTVVDLFSPTLVTRNTSATLLDNGNFVLQELNPDGSIKRVLWQSFDYPTDTLLPGMKLGINLKTGHRWSLTSWRSKYLPADGSFTLTLDPNRTGQMVILRRGNIHWTSGFENTGLNSSGPYVRFYYISNENEVSFTYLTRTYDSEPALRIYLGGQLKATTLELEVRCRSIDEITGCSEYESAEYNCWRDYYDNTGCAEREFEELGCRKDYFVGRTDNHYVYRDGYEYDERYNWTLYDCQRICWTSCSCMAFSYATTNRTSCTIYGQALFNESKYEGYHPFREDYAILHRYDPMDFKESKKWIWLVIGIGTLAPLVLCYLVYNKFHIRGKAKKIQKLLLHQLMTFYDYVQRDKMMNTELHYFTFQSISVATKNFSTDNKLGEGGFGAVYKGELVDGQEVAVKRLSTSSEQGVNEFKNETELIAKLQHTNLVRLIGCCIEKKEKILVYEYMPNKSLDFFLFDPKKKGLLDWINRFAIIDGIAQGLLYLHRFSRLRVIHRDLKASNILLDDYLKPKISDFGMAKLFENNESEANTCRVVGTRGYMPPEYMLEGIVSTKTDVFGFGVLLLKIVSSKVNHGSYDVKHPLNLLGLAWELWKEGRGLELMDPVLEDSCTPKEVMTCIHVGLLCVQYHAMDRPTMSEVISMLTNENMHLPEPKRPAFFIERHESDSARDENLENGSVNGQSVSIVVVR